MAELCPHLGVVDHNNRRQPPIEFPSFENQCLAAGAGELILLGDQATYCFNQQHRSCPRFRRTQVAATGETNLEFVPLHAHAEDAWSSPWTPDGAFDAGFTPLLGADAEIDDRAGRKRWAWIGATLVFASVFLCGSMVASYTGWQWIARNLPARTADGRVDTVSAAATAPVVYLVQTATPDPALQAQAKVAGPTVPVIVAPPENGAAPAFPVAVTPTPIVLAPPLADAVTGEATPESLLPHAAPPINVDVPIPTRRPTPIFDLPTSTPIGDLLPTATATPVPLGTPVIIFAADEPSLKEDRCTIVRWNVKNVREVYYQNLPMSGQGEREECIEDESVIYTLLVVLGDGSSQIYTTTVTYLPPTPTPTVTPSFTPEPVFTPTWTPIPPTATPAPVVNYGVALTVNGATTLTCSPGQTCDAGLLVTNAGDATDTLIVTITQGGAFASQLCRPDGVCAGNDLNIANVGPGNTAYVSLRITVPADAASSQSTTYALIAASGGSNRTVTSATVNVTVATP
jgi:hypothetical protein